MEDVRLGRKMNSAVKSVTINAGSPTTIVGFNSKRVALHFSNGVTNQSFLGPISNPPTIGSGVNVTATAGFITLRIEDWGPLIQSAWQAMSAAGTPTATVMESFIDGE